MGAILFQLGRLLLRAGFAGAAGLCWRLASARERDAAHFHAAADRLIGAGALYPAERLCRARLRAQPDDRDARERLAFLLLDSSRGEEAAACFAELDRADGLTAATTAAYIKRHLDIAHARAGESYCRWMENVRVETACWSIMRDGHVYNDDVHAKNLAKSPWVRGRVSAGGGTVVAALPAPVAMVEEECIFVGGDDNYSHWLFRNMLKLSTLDYAGLLHRYPWLVNDDLRGYQLEYLQLLGHDPAFTRRVPRQAVIDCRHVLVPALHVSTHAVRQGVEWLRGRVAAHAAPTATRRLFLSRRDNGRRRVLNEDELYDAVASLGFERIVPGEMTAAQQIAEFSSARVILAAHGAGLTNMIFTPPGAAIVELTSTAIEHMNLFRKLALSTGHHVVTVRSADYAGATAVDVNTDYRVEVAAVRSAVDEALQRSA